MKNNNRCIKTLFIAIFNCALCYTASAQQADIQYLGQASPASWVPVATGEKPDSTNVWIRSGDVVTIDSDVTIKGMLIDQGATLNATGNAASGSIYRLTPVTADVTILNNGTLGATSGSKDGISLTLSSNTKNFTLTGSGKTAIASFFVDKANNGLNGTLNQDATFNAGGMAFSAIPRSNALATDNITFNISKDKTVKLTNASGQFHGLPANSAGGNYTYNINGTLDVSASNAAQNITSLPNAGSTVTLNIAGLLKMGSVVNISAPNTQQGRLALNVLDGGVADASLTTTFTSYANFFTTHGSGVLKRRVANGEVVFFVGSPGSAYPSPVALFNSGTADVVAVSVKNQFDVSPPNSTKVINKQWTITPARSSGNNITVKPVWGAADAASLFNPAMPTMIYSREAGSNTWVSKTAVVNGTGTISNPYRAIASAYTKFGVFIVQNASLDADAGTVSLYPNPTANEVNVDFPETLQAGTVQITNYQGRNMVISPLNKGVKNWKYNISSWPSGYYFLKMKSGDRESAIKFIKQ
ncbi:MAG: T9SS type A sorting domain-containing protein [Sphingobacteriales bacterium]|nr:MAG: T9SS type A sorting domain-containing protein [Sphingobacteriales bacterium]